MATQGWIGVDLDGTLAHYDHWRGPEHIGEPIAPMVDRVKKWRAEGKSVRIFTARVFKEEVGTAFRHGPITSAIMRWCKLHIGEVLPVTNIKDYEMIELWDDRAVQVIPNTGRRVGE